MSPGVGPSKEKFVGALSVGLYREDFSVGLLNIWMLVIVLQMESLMWCKCSKFKQDFFFFSISWKTVKFKLVEQHGSWNENVSSNQNVSSNRFGIEISFVWQQRVSFMIFLISTISFNHFSMYEHYISSSHNYNSERRGVLFKQ